MTTDIPQEWVDEAAEAMYRVAFDGTRFVDAWPDTVHRPQFIAQARAVLAVLAVVADQNVTGRCPEHHQTFCEPCGWVNPAAAKRLREAAQEVIAKRDTDRYTNLEWHHALDRLAHEVGEKEVSDG